MNFYGFFCHFFFIKNEIWGCKVGGCHELISTYTPIADGVGDIGCRDSIYALPVLTEPIETLYTLWQDFEVQRLNEVGRT